VVEQERVDTYVNDKQRLWNEQQEKARVRGDNALKREVLDNVNSFSCFINDTQKKEYFYSNRLMIMSSMN
jgi:hypothetical protein